MPKETIGIDFDGVLNTYTKGWNNGIIDTAPVEGAIDACARLITKGFNLYVLTARTDHGPVYAWLQRCGFPYMEVSNVKRPAIAYIDDRAIRFTNWKDIQKYFS